MKYLISYPVKRNSAYNNININIYQFTHFTQEYALVNQYIHINKNFHFKELGIQNILNGKVYSFKLR